MKVMHFHFGKDGGTERFYINIVNALGRRGVKQLSYIRPDLPWRAAVEKMTDIVETHYRRMSLDGLTLKFRVARHVKAEQPDALIGWTPKACRLLPAKTSAIRIARLGDYPPRLDYYKNVDVLVCNAPDIADHVRKMGWTRGVEVISNFTRMERVTPVERKPLDTPEEAILIMAMGRLVERKGFDTLIDALAHLPGAHLWLIGEGPEGEALRKRAKELGIMDRIRFVGWQQDVRPFVAACDVFVMPSRFEPLGNVVLEAWAQERPVVSTRSQGPLWFMQDGENGLMVDIDDVHGMASAVKRVVDDVDLRVRLAQGGRATLEERFSEDAITDAYIDLFKRKP